jgi:hypothetical protein
MIFLRAADERNLFDRPYKAEAAGSTPAAPTAKALVRGELVALEAANSISR